VEKGLLKHSVSIVFCVNRRTVSCKCLFGQIFWQVFLTKNISGATAMVHPIRYDLFEAFLGSKVVL